MNKFSKKRVLEVAELARPSESTTGALCGPSEVAAKVERLLFDVINKAEAVLKQLPQYGTKMPVSRKDSNRMQDSRRSSVSHIVNARKQEGQQHSAIGSSEISSPLVLNERPGVRYLCCDRFFKCDGRNLIAREIWPSDGGCIELNRKELKRFIINNEARRSSGSKLNRHVAGRSSLECATDNRMEHISTDDNVVATESTIQSFNSIYRSDLCDVCQHKKEGCLAEFNSISASIDADVKAQQQLRMQGNGTKDTSSEISTTSITESPETLMSSETIDLISTTADESSSDENESPIGAYNFIQNWGDQLVPSMKPDGTIVIPGVVHVNNFESLNGVVLELKVLIKSPKESRRFSVKIDCPDFKPRSVKVNGIKTHRLIGDHCKTFDSKYLLED